MQSNADNPHQTDSGSRPVREPSDFLDQPMVRQGLAIISLAVFAVSIVVAIIALNGIVSTWFEYQYQDIARAVLSGALAAVALWALWFVSRRPRRL